MRRVECTAGEDPECVVCAGLVGSSVLSDPIGSCEDDQRVWCAEIDPEQAAVGAELCNATSRSQITIVVSCHSVRSAEVFERGIGKVFALAPERLWSGEMLLKERFEAEISYKSGPIASWDWLRILPHP